MTDERVSVGQYLGQRLCDVGITDYFAVAGDYNLILLDELLKVERLRMVSCCNELNAGYAADGYARQRNSAAALVVTFSVGGLSALNAVAGAYAEDLPVIAISGGPNTNSEAEFEVLHHSLGKIDYKYQREIYSRVTAQSVVVIDPAAAPLQIDGAIETALRTRKPVYIEIACNIAGALTSPPPDRNFQQGIKSDREALSAAVEHAAKVLNAAEKPVLLAGVKMRPAGAIDACRKLLDHASYPAASMPNAKSMIQEDLPGYMGIYWGPVSDPGCSEIVEAADICLAIGPVFTDYTTTGHRTALNLDHVVNVQQETVHFPDRVYTKVAMAEFLTALTPKLEKNDSALVNFRRIEDPPRPRAGAATDTPLTVRFLFSRVRDLITSDGTLLVETGDSWFNGMDVRLPGGARFEIQMQYGSIGWSVGAVLGYAISDPSKRLVACIGDGSFQLTGQEVSTMIRYGMKPIIFLINNGGYTIEVEIHDGPYNVINSWNYAQLIDVFNGQSGNGWSTKVTTETELDAAVEKALAHDGLSFIEVIIDRDDCNKNLLRWGNRVARNNGRPPRKE
jgi:pyruvate decarboxylase